MRLELINDIKPKGMDSAYIDELPFDQSLKALRIKGYELISLKDNAELRMQEGKDHYISRKGNRVRERILNIPGEGRFITRKYSAVLDHPRKATRVHKKGKEYFVSNGQIGIVMRDSIKIPYDMKEIPIDAFGEEGITMFCFGKNAKDYGLFLKEAGISKMPLQLDNEETIGIKGKPYANQLFLNGIDFKSALHGANITCLSDRIRSRGIKVIGAQN